MESVGQYLKRERELRGISIEEISADTRVGVELYKALERDEYEPLPHPTFVKGFIKAYCKHLGLDDTEALLKYETHVKEVEEEKKKDAPEASGFSTEGVGAFLTQGNLIAAGLVVVGVAVIGGYLFFGTGGKGGSGESVREDVSLVDKPEAVPAEAVPAEAVPAEAVSIDAAPVVSAPSDGSELTPGAASTEAVPTEDAEKTTGAKGRGGAKRSPKSSTPPLTSVDEDRVKSPVGGATTGDRVVKETHTLKVYAREMTWIKARLDGGLDSGGASPEVLLRRGETLRWRASEVFFC